MDTFVQANTDTNIFTACWAKVLQMLKTKVESYNPVPGLNVSQSRILMVGPFKSGKSSFVNTINSIFQNRISSQAIVSSKEESHTSTYRQYQVRNTGFGALKFRLCDTRGIGDNFGPDVAEWTYIFEGNIPDGYKFDPNCPISPRSRGFIHTPGLNEKIHCVAFVFGANEIKITTDEIWNNVILIRKRMEKMGIPYLFLLSKIDQCSRLLTRDLRNVFASKQIQELVEIIAYKTGVQRADIMPIKNYENENDPDNIISILALQALDRMLGYANDFLIGQKDIIERHLPPE